MTVIAHAALAIGLLVAGVACGPERGVAPDGSARLRTSVVMVTFDGVRPPDLFEAPDPAMAAGTRLAPAPPMPYLLNELGPTGAFLGRPGVGKPMKIANPIGVSMPGYQSMFLGRPTFCFSNQCGPARGALLFDRVRDAFDLPREAVTLIASWRGMCRGLGLGERVDAACGPEAIRERWQQQRSDAPGAERPPMPESIDRAAFELALDRLRGAPPALLFLALDESDGTGHADDYAGHIATLARYDAWLRILVARIDALAAEGFPITLILTTDHGRGSGETWKEHRWNVPGTRDVWLFARGPGVRAGGPIAARRTYTLANVGPTIAHLMGLPPSGAVIEAAVIEDLLAEGGGD